MKGEPFGLSLYWPWVVSALFLKSGPISLRTVVRRKKQDVKVPSRRRIQGSKIAKGLQNVKVLVNCGPFYEKKILKKSLTMPKKLKGGILWGFLTCILSENIEKLKGNPSEIFFREKSLTEPKKLEGPVEFLR